VILLFMMTYQLPIVESDVTAQPWQSAIGANYNVPMVSYFDAIGPELTNGNITLAQITPDDVHPNDLGHAYAAQFLEQNLQLAIDNFPSGTALEPIPATEAPLYSSDFEFTSLVEGNGTWGPPLNPTSNQGWVQVSTSPGGQLNFPDAGLQSSTAGSTLDFTVTGKEILVGYWVNNAPMGQASVTVDGGAPATLDGFSATSNGDHTMYQAATGLADGPHQVQIQLLSTKDSGSTGNTFDLLTVGAGGVYGSEQQSITFAALPNQEYGTAPFTVSATASSGLTVSFASTTPSVCSVSGSTVSLLSVGTCTINAAQSGNSTYGAATPVSQSFTVSRGAQTISFAALPAVTYGAAPLSLAATASSALPVSFASTSSSVCTVSGSTVSLLAAGTCTIDASQTGNTDYAAATVVSQSFAVHHEAQTISFAVIPATTLVTGSVSLNATASSGLPVTFTSTTASLCTVSGSTATLLAVGTCNVTASQAGSAQYGSTASSRGLVITLAPQSISFAAIPSMTFGASPFGVTATASSGLPVAFSSATPAICTVSGNTVTAAVSGFCGITANQAGNYEYSAAPAMIQSFTVTNTALNVTGYSPQFVVGGSAGQNITVTGSGFQPSTTATYGGVAHSITYVNGNTMVLPLTSGDLASVGVEPIVLSNATPAGAWLVNLPVLYETSATLANSQLAAGDQARLENLIVKGRSGKPVTIATIGGSITEGVGASDVEHSYASLLQDWWNQTFPTSASTLVNAGISGTASDYGSMRLQRDVLSKNPDLVVVEFAVNDNVPNEFFGDTYEGVVRQLLDAPSHPAVMLLFMMTYELPVVESDVTAQPLQSSIGTNYDVPMVSYYNAISTEMTNGNLTIAQLTADGVHPTDLGHAYAAQFLEQDLQNAINNFAPGTTPEAIPQTAGAVYSTDFEFTSLEEGNGSWGSPLTPSNNQGWVQVAEAPEGTLIFPDEGLQTSTPGSTLSFTVSGKDLFIGYWLLNGPMGQIDVSVDGGTPVLRDGYYADVTPSCSPTLCTSGYHTMYRLATGLADGPHQVQIQLLSTKDSGSTGNTFDLLTVGAGGVF
jgi:lysophospholipase L1-like esterase